MLLKEEWMKKFMVLFMKHYHHLIPGLGVPIHSSQMVLIQVQSIHPSVSIITGSTGIMRMRKTTASTPRAPETQTSSELTNGQMRFKDFPQMFFLHSVSNGEVIKLGNPMAQTHLPTDLLSNNIDTITRSIETLMLPKEAWMRKFTESSLTPFHLSIPG